MSFTYNAWMPARQKHDLTELAKAARAKANGKTYEPKPYVHVKGRIIATINSVDLAALKREAGIAEPQLVQDPATWTMTKPGEWVRDVSARPSEIAEGLREIERCKRSMRLAAEHDAHVDAERVDVPHLQVVRDEPTPVVDAPPPAPKLRSSRSVAGRARVDCVPCGKRHYVRARPCQPAGAAS